MTQDEKELLRLELNLLKDANKTLIYSYDSCSKIGIKENYTYEELDKFEALTSRFARVSDILIQKIFRLIDIIELELPGTVIDRINRMEKRGALDADKFKEIRRLRNEIAHEYIPTAIENIFKDVLRLTPFILDCVKNILEKYDE